jgi:hypothetical protein
MVGIAYCETRATVNTDTFYFVNLKDASEAENLAALVRFIAVCDDYTFNPFELAKLIQEGFLHRVAKDTPAIIIKWERGRLSIVDLPEQKGAAVITNHLTKIEE